MRSIKQILFFLLLPAVAAGQTVHVHENRIVYKGIVNVANVNKEELYGRAKEAVSNNVKGDREKIVADDKEKGMIEVKGSIRLVTPYELIRKVEYILEVSVDNGNYKYRIDSVYLKQEERGGEKIKASSEKLLKAVDVTGPEAAEAEKLLNEIDMNFQKLLALINADMKKAVVATNKEMSKN